MSVQVLKARLRAFVSNPPIFTIARILARLGIESKAITSRELVRFIEAGEPARLEAIFRKIFHDAPQSGCDPDRDLVDKSVLEIGCGRNGGLAPFMMRQNAKHYIGIDPMVNQEILRSDAVMKALERRYFSPGTNDPADAVTLRKRYETRCQFRQGANADSEVRSNSLDMITSISCLEHIDDLESEIASFSETLKPGGCHIHLVNFSNHLDKEKPFHWIYELDPEAFKHSHGDIINLKRPSDVKSLFEKLEFETTLTPIDIRPDAVPTNTLHPWWKEHYGIAELGIRTAVLHAVKKP